MTEQPQPWAERTVEMPPEQGSFRRGVAPVSARKPSTTESFPAVPHQYQPTGTGWPQTGHQPRVPMEQQLRQLRIGSGWSKLGGLFAFICWGIWAISARGNLTSPVLAFLLSLLVAVGLFALVRLLGRVIWERQLGRTRYGARGAHLVAGLFLTGVGIAYLRQTQWIMDAWSWVFNR